MKSTFFGLSGVFLSMLMCESLLRAESPSRSASVILKTYVEDFQTDPAAAEKREFGIRVSGKGGGNWTVVLSGEKNAEGRWGVRLREGNPKEPTFYYATDTETLASIDAGTINALTAAGKAFPGDPTPMEFEWMPGARKFDVNPLSFHFWTRGFPEKVRFERDLGRVVHGCNNVVFYYQEGFRSAFASLAKGQGANNGPGQPIVAPFPTMVIAIKGVTKGRVAGKQVEAKAGEMIFIPPMTPHEWWNDQDELAEAILLFFGDGA